MTPSLLGIVGQSPHDEWGSSVSFVGDVNGDNVTDIAVGSSKHDSGRGKACVLFGSKHHSGWIQLHDVDGRGFCLEGTTTNDRVGLSVGPAGDINGDGLADVIIGADGVDLGGLDSGMCPLCREPA